MRCSICGNEPSEELIHLPIYVNGSEGVDVCYACKMRVTEFLRSIKQAFARSRMAMAKFRRGLEGKDLKKLK